MRGSLIRMWLLFALMSVAVAPSVFAGSASVSMRVSVNVIARAIVSVASSPAAVMVTKADIARGFVDVVDPIVLNVRSNSRNGYLLEAEPIQAGFRLIEITFGDSMMSVGGAESWISRPYVQGGEVIAMHMRVHLDPNTQAGSYPLPISFNARPL